MGMLHSRMHNVLPHQGSFLNLESELAFVA